MSEKHPAIVGIGGVLGEEVVDNDEFIRQSGIKDSSDKRIRELTLIEQRYYAARGTLASDMGVQAAEQALAMARVPGNELDGIYLTTLTPDYFGSYTATEIHKRLHGKRHCFAWELTAACTGAVAALSHAAEKVILKPESTILTVGTELMSRIINFDDKRSAILFGDGAGATIVRGVEGAQRPVFSVLVEPDRKAIYAPGGGAAEPDVPLDDPRRKLHMDGKAVARHALTLMPEVLVETLTADGALDKHWKIDWDRYGLFVPHQANGILIQNLWETLGVPKEKQVLTVDKHGNTSSASILLALRAAFEDGRLGEHQRILMVSIGAGMIAAAGAIDVRID